MKRAFASFRINLWTYKVIRQQQLSIGSILYQQTQTNYWKEGRACSISTAAVEKLLPKFSSLKKYLCYHSVSMCQRPKYGFTRSYGWGESLWAQGRPLPFLLAVCGCHCLPLPLESLRRQFKSRQLVSSEQTNDSRGREMTAFDSLLLVLMTYHFYHIDTLVARHTSTSHSRWENYTRVSIPAGGKMGVSRIRNCPLPMPQTI